MTDIQKCPLDLAHIEEQMVQMNNAVPIPENHIFSGGIYIRQIAIPKGTLVMGKRHRIETCNVLLRGVLELYPEDGEDPVIIRGPIVFTSQPYTKKFAYCLEDAIFMNIIPTKETDPDEVERQVIIPEREYLESKEGLKCLL